VGWAAETRLPEDEARAARAAQVERRAEEERVWRQEAAETAARGTAEQARKRADEEQAWRRAAAETAEAAAEQARA
jgi:hypothetical protein